MPTPAPANPSTTTYTEAEWRAEGERRFGTDMMQWKFTCPVCHHMQCGADFKAAGAPETAIGFSCIGRWLPKAQTREAFTGSSRRKKGPCSYAGGGLFKLNPVTVHVNGRAEPIQMFAFAEA